MKEYTGLKARVQAVALGVAELLNMSDTQMTVSVHKQEPISKTWPVVIKTGQVTLKNILVHLGERWIWVSMYGIFEFKTVGDQIEFMEINTLKARLPERTKKF